MRVAVTGLGVVSPIGVGEESFFAALESGRSGVTVDETAAVKQRYGAATLPTIVLLDADGKVAHKLDHFVEPKELLPLLAGLK